MGAGDGDVRVDEHVGNNINKITQKKTAPATITNDNDNKIPSRQSTRILYLRATPFDRYPREEPSIFTQLFLTDAVECQHLHVQPFHKDKPVLGRKPNVLSHARALC